MKRITAICKLWLCLTSVGKNYMPHICSEWRAWISKRILPHRLDPKPCPACWCRGCPRSQNGQPASFQSSALDLAHDHYGFVSSSCRAQLTSSDTYSYAVSFVFGRSRFLSTYRLFMRSLEILDLLGLIRNQAEWCSLLLKSLQHADSKNQNRIYPVRIKFSWHFRERLQPRCQCLSCIVAGCGRTGHKTR